jgi:1-aminocyclopropane-1-carboxylate deaminase
MIRYLIPEALEKKCDTLISIGGVQSNHTRQVAGVAAKLGLKVQLTTFIIYVITVEYFS